MLLCVFERDRLWELYQGQPGLAFDLTWIAAREERMLDEHLLSVGQRTGEERAAHLLLFLFDRAGARSDRGGRSTFPFSQPLIADALGLSLVHTNRILNRFTRRGLIELNKRQMALKDLDGLKEIAEWEEVTKAAPAVHLGLLSRTSAATVSSSRAGSIGFWMRDDVAELGLEVADAIARAHAERDAELGADRWPARALVSPRRLASITATSGWPGPPAWPRQPAPTRPGRALRGRPLRAPRPFPRR